MESLKLIVATTILTILIWTTADQLVSDTAEIEVVIRAVPQAGIEMIVRTDPPGQELFQLVVSGPNRLVDQLRSLVQVSGRPTLSIPVRDDHRGAYNVIVKDSLIRAMENNQLLRGLRIDSVTPPEVRVIVDQLSTVTMPVFIQRGAMEYDVPPQAEPAEVRVTMPSRELEAMVQKRIPLEVGPLFRDKPFGQPQTIPGVPLPTRLGNVDVHYDPPTVVIRGTVGERTKTGEVHGVQILVQASFQNFNRHRIETRDGRTLITRALTVQGPPSVVDGLTAGRIPITGRVIVTGSDLSQAGTFIELQPVFDLPPAVSLASPVAPVELKLVPIEQPPAALEP